MVISLFIFPSFLVSSENAVPISVRSAVIFNTLCSKCHEGECSGRLSFDTGSKTDSRHIRRYTGDANLSKSKIKEFFTLLNYMKKKCAVYMPDNVQWKNSSKDISRFMLPSSKGYFIPLGSLESGKYHIKIKVRENIHFQTEVLSNHFDHFLNQEMCPEKKNMLQFELNRPTTVFVRIKSRSPMHIVSFKVEKDH